MIKKLLIAMLIVTGVISYSLEMQTQVKQIERNVQKVEKPELNDNVEYPLDRLGVTVVEIRPYDNKKIELIYKVLEVKAEMNPGVNTNINYPFEKGRFKYKLKKVLISKELANKLIPKSTNLANVTGTSNETEVKKMGIKVNSVELKFNLKEKNVNRIYLRNGIIYVD